MIKVTCVLCGGTGRLVLFKSWFTKDGFTSVKCGICDGSGRSSYRPDPDWTKVQKRLRVLAEVRNAE